jgi:hypothetical protein
MSNGGNRADRRPQLANPPKRGNFSCPYRLSEASVHSSKLAAGQQPCELLGIPHSRICLRLN